MVTQKKLKEANVPRHYPLHTFSLHVPMFLARYKYPTPYNKTNADHTHDSFKTQIALNTNQRSKQLSKTITYVVTFWIHVTSQNSLLSPTKAVAWEPRLFCIWDLDSFLQCIQRNARVVHHLACQSAKSFWNILGNYLFYHQLWARAYVYGKSQKTSILKDGVRDRVYAQTMYCAYTSVYFTNYQSCW